MSEKKFALTLTALAAVLFIPVFFLEGREVLMGFTAWYVIVLVMIGNGVPLVENIWRIKDYSRKFLKK